MIVYFTRHGESLFNRAERHGSHDYTAETFGLSDDQLAKDFAFYTEAYL